MLQDSMTAIIQSKWCQTFLLFLSILGMSSATAYAATDTCPVDASIQFDRALQQWKTPIRGWVSGSIPLHSAGADRLALTAVKLKIDHKTGDTVECAYEAADGEAVVFTRAVDLAHAPLAPAEIVPTDQAAWKNGSSRDEFVCHPSSTNECVFENVAALPDVHVAVPDVVHIKFVIGTAFNAWVCNYFPAIGNVCGGPYQVGSNAYASFYASRNKFCIDVNRFARIWWGHYYFKVDTSIYAEDSPLEVWGVSTNPQFSLPKGITLYKTDVSRDFTLCQPPWSDG